MEKNDIVRFFDFLESYLLADLNTMVYEVPERPSGGLGYPAIQTILSGMELLGSVLSGGKKDETAFYHFWDKYFAVDSPAYKDDRLKKILRNCVRNGTAHVYLAKFGIQVSKTGRNNLTKARDNHLNLDLIELFEDFKGTFQGIRDRLLGGSDKEELGDFAAGYQELMRDLEAPRVAIEDCVRRLPVYEVSAGESVSYSSEEYHGGNVSHSSEEYHGGSLTVAVRNLSTRSDHL